MWDFWNLQRILHKINLRIKPLENPFNKPTCQPDFSVAHRLHHSVWIMESSPTPHQPSAPQQQPSQIKTSKRQQEQNGLFFPSTHERTHAPRRTECLQSNLSDSRLITSHHNKRLFFFGPVVCVSLNINLIQTNRYKTCPLLRVLKSSLGRIWKTPLL